MFKGTIRGTTPTHTFTTDVDLSEATEVYVTYSQNDKVIVEKTINDATISETKLVVELSQKDTLLFDDRCKVEIQIRAIFVDGTAIASNIMSVPVGKILKDGEI